VRLSEVVCESFPDFGLSVVALALRGWGWMRGLVALEIYGHFKARTCDPAKLYGAELADLVSSLNLSAVAR
jgi:hypothetical protein